MSITTEQIVGEVVAEDYRTASVFQFYGIDFCCNGNRTIGQACESLDLNPPVLINALEQATLTDKDGLPDFRSWPLDLLVEYIEKKHHRFVRQKVQEIIPLLNKVMRVHGHHHPELLETEHLFRASANELESHMRKEELVLFPYIRNMTKINFGDLVSEPSPFGTVQNPIAMMQHEHDAEGDRFRKIALLTNNYTVPEDACNSYRLVYSLLREFEQDLHLHIHLENNLLFPEAILLEQKLKIAK